MTKYTDFMLDLETLGTSSNAAVVQIGLVGFNPETGETSPPSKLKVRAHPKSSIDYNTLSWWMNQSEEARKSVFPGEEFVMEPEAALSKLRTAFEAFAVEDFRIWSKPGTFDIPIIESLHRTCGAESYPIPWKHWNTRCLRTLADAAGLAWTDYEKPTVPHDAGEDALAQAKTALKCFELLKGLDNGDAGEYSKKVDG